jgi:FkbM family methyltransferase
MADGTRFLGDLNDRYSTLCGIDAGREAWLVALLCGLADRHQGTVLDVGSNQGAVAAALGRHIGPHRKLFAFEPLPETAARAAATLALNGLSNASLLSIAVGASDNPIAFHFRVGHSDLASAARDLREEEGTYGEVLVPCQRLDSLLADLLLDRVGLIKIDVEGFEPQVVRGAQELIRRDRPAIVFEYWPKVADPLGWHVEGVAELITSVGGAYTFEAYDGDRPVEYPPRNVTGVYNIVASPSPSGAP